MKLRFHRSTLEESLKTEHEISSREELIKLIETEFAPLPVKIEPDRLWLGHRGFDERTGWDSYILLLEGVGVIGFTDGPLPV